MKTPKEARDLAQTTSKVITRLWGICKALVPIVYLVVAIELLGLVLGTVGLALAGWLDTPIGLGLLGAGLLVALIVLLKARRLAKALRGVLSLPQRAPELLETVHPQELLDQAKAIRIKRSPMGVITSLNQMRELYGDARGQLEEVLDVRQLMSPVSFATTGMALSLSFWALGFGCALLVMGLLLRG